MWSCECRATNPIALVGNALGSAQRGNRPTLQQIQLAASKGTLDVDRPAHFLFQRYRQLSHCTYLCIVECRPPLQETGNIDLARTVQSQNRHPSLLGNTASDGAAI